MSFDNNCSIFFSVPNMMSRVWVVFSGLLMFHAWECLAKAGHCEKEQVKDGETNVFPICSTGNWDNSYIDISKFKSAGIAKFLLIANIYFGNLEISFMVDFQQMAMLDFHDFPNFPTISWDP